VEAVVRRRRRGGGGAAAAASTVIDLSSCAIRAPPPHSSFFPISNRFPVLFPHVPNSRTPHLSSLPHRPHSFFRCSLQASHRHFNRFCHSFFPKKTQGNSPCVSCHKIESSRVALHQQHFPSLTTTTKKDEDAPVVATNTLRRRPRLPGIDTEMWFNCPLRLFLDTSCSFCPPALPSLHNCFAPILNFTHAAGRPRRSRRAESTMLHKNRMPALRHEGQVASSTAWLGRSQSWGSLEAEARSCDSGDDQ
jgi:hypothetical protein